MRQLRHGTVRHNSKFVTHADPCHQLPETFSFFYIHNNYSNHLLFYLCLHYTK